MHEAVTPGVYKHYKQAYYVVECVAISSMNEHEEEGPTPQNTIVVYYSQKYGPTPKRWRTVEQFTEEVELRSSGGQVVKVPRFVRVNDGP